MKRTLLFLTTLLTMITLSACTNQVEQKDIVTTMFTHYDLAKHIVGDHMSVSMLVPIGQDIHSFEASSMDMIQIEKSKLFLYTSDDIDTWISDPSSIGGKDTVVLNMSEAIHHDEEVALLADEHDHDHEEDIHYWVDPVAALDMLTYIYEHVITIDPDHMADYTANYESYHEEITTAHQAHIAYFTHENHLNETIYFAGHNAMSAYGERYGLTITSLFSEFKPDDDLTSSEIIAFSNEVKNDHIHYLFIEALEVPRAAHAIKDALSNEDYALTLLELHAYHNLSQEDWDQGITYVDLMYRNLSHIQTALGE